MAGGFDNAAIAALRAAARPDSAVCAGEPVRPEDDLAAITRSQCICIDGGIAAHENCAGVVLRPLALIVPADEHRPATRIPRRIQRRIAKQPNLVTQYPNLATLLPRPQS